MRASRRPAPVPRQNWRSAVVDHHRERVPAKTSRDRTETSCADAVRNAIALKRRGTPTHGRSAHRRRRTSTLTRQLTALVRLRVVRSGDVIRPFPGTRPRTLPSASEPVVASARPSPRPDVFAPGPSSKFERCHHRVKNLFRDVALFLPFPCSKERQTAASASPRRRSKIGGFYEG